MADLGVHLCRLIMRLFILFVLTGVHFSACLPLDRKLGHLRAISGDNVTITCHEQTLLFPHADWVFAPCGTEDETERCLGEVCLNEFVSRSFVRREDNFTLTILNVTIDDSGTYTCIAYDDFTEYRYSTELNVSDSVNADGTTTRFSNSENNRTSTTDVVRTSVTIIATTASACFLCVTAFIAFVLFRCTHNSRCKGLGNKEPGRADSLIVNMINNNAEASSCSLKFELETLKGKGFDDCLTKVQQSRSLIIAFLELFRKLYDGSNESVPESAAYAFRLLAGSSALWWRKLTGRNAVRLRILRLLFYECSNYALPSRIGGYQIASEKSPLMGVATLNGIVWTVSRGSDIIHVFHKKAREEVVVSGLKDPVDIVTCAKIQSFYIADQQECCIWQVTFGGSSNKLKELRELIPKKLSMRNGSLLITTDSSVLLKISPPGDVLTKIHVPCVKPTHAVETDTGTFIVCCESDVREVVDGVELRRFVCKHNMPILPSYMLLDSSGHLLVADTSSSNIFLLDRKRKRSWTLLNNQRDALSAPHRLCMDEDSGQLHVVQRQNQYIQTYAVKRLRIRQKCLELCLLR